MKAILAAIDFSPVSDLVGAEATARTRARGGESVLVDTHAAAFFAIGSLGLVRALPS